MLPRKRLKSIGRAAIVKQVTMTGQMNSNLDISYCYLGLDFTRPRLEDIDIYAIHF